MKKIFLLLCILIAYSLASAQTEKGKWFAAGTSSLRLDVGKELIKYGGESQVNYNFAELNFDPMAGYFVIEKVPVGLFFDISGSRQKDPEDQDKWSRREIIAGPFARYYIKQFDKLFPYAEARVGIGSYKETYSDGDIYKESVLAYRLGVGASYFLIENVAFDAFLGYAYSGYTDKSDEPKSTNYCSSVEINLGIVITFGK